MHVGCIALCMLRILVKIQCVLCALILLHNSCHNMVYFLQDFEALTPNLLARTVETVEGGGLVVLLLRTMSSLKQLYTMAMVCVFLWPLIELNCNQYLTN